MTQPQIMDRERQAILDGNLTFLEIMAGDNPISREEYAKLLAKHPRLWARFSNWFK